MVMMIFLDSGKIKTEVLERFGSYLVSWEDGGPGYLYS